MKAMSFAVKAAGATSLALLLTTSAFADSMYRRDDSRGDRSRAETSGQYNSDRRGSDSRSENRNGSYRENEHVNLSGRIRSFSRENNGYRVYLDRGPAFWVPESYYRRHSRDWRVGVSITLGGIFRGGSIIVDDGAYYPPAGGGYYGDGYVRGVVDRVDYRRGIMFIRDDRDGRIVEADMRTDRRGRLNVDDLRPGDFVELSGGWVRGDIFTVDRIESVRSGRY